jgi:hypothetical protein
VCVCLFIHTLTHTHTQVHYIWSVLETDAANVSSLLSSFLPHISKYAHAHTHTQVHYIWSVLETDAANVSSLLSSFLPSSPLAFPFANRIATIEAVWRTLDGGCQNNTISTAERGCMFDGTCVCQQGWTGPACNIECRGGASNPCSNHGICRYDGKCECFRGWTGFDCSIECSGARDNPGHFPCNLNGYCNGWYVDPRTHYEYGPVDFEEAR